jgi:ubiquinone/menaquinone biosynthesis C-methylase UbiE/uncharacterized protein YbaR (Trm112 family)
VNAPAAAGPIGREAITPDTPQATARTGPNMPSFPLGDVRDLVCPSCAGALMLKGGTGGDGIVDGTLMCQECERQFDITQGVPRLVEGLEGQLKDSADSYGYQWSGFWNGLFDRGDVFGLQFDETAHYFMRSLGIDRGALRGKTVLDAGTGSGRVPMSIHDAAGRIFAVDMHSGITGVAGLLARFPSVHVVQANLLKLPFRDQFFDIVWSSGVLMYAPDASEVFRAIARKVRPGGRLFISVYGKDVNHYRMFRHLMPWAHKLPLPALYALTAALAIPLYVGFNSMLWAVRTFRKGPGPHRMLMFTVEDSSPKSYKSIVLNLFDQLHPKAQSEHSVEEVLDWFRASGFEDVVVTESIGMVAVRGVKSPV